MSNSRKGKVKPRKVKRIEKQRKKRKDTDFGMAKIKTKIKKKLKSAKLLEKKTSKEKKMKIKKPEKKYILTGISGFDALLERGIPRGSAILIAGGTGAGKTIFCLQTLAKHASNGERCFYMSFEESDEKLMQHMKDFGWDAEKLIKSGKLKIQKYSPFEISRSVEAMLAKEKGELLIDIQPVVLPEGFRPDLIVIDSLTAVASAFIGKEDSYRVYIEQLFSFFEKIGSTSLLITETEQIPKIFSTTGVEEFLADGVIVLYNIKKGGIRESAIEILKMRGEKHQKKIVAMRITDKGIVVYPEQDVFGGIEEKG